MERVAVWVSARDPISEAGVVSALRPRPEVRVLPADDAASSQVAVVVADAVDDDALRLVRMVRRQTPSQAVLVAGRLEDGDVVTAVEAGVLGPVRRSQATPPPLGRGICGAPPREGRRPPHPLGPP